MVRVRVRYPMADLRFGINAVKCLKCSDISKLVNLQYERCCVFNVQ